MIQSEETCRVLMKVVDEFTEWADNRISGIESCPSLSDGHRKSKYERIKAYEGTKRMLLEIIRRNIDEDIS